MFSYGTPGNKNYFLFQILEIIRIPNTVLVYIHNYDEYRVYSAQDFEGLHPPTEAELILYKKNKHYKELALEYQKSMAPQFKREYDSVDALRYVVKGTKGWFDDDF